MKLIAGILAPLLLVGCSDLKTGRSLESSFGSLAANGMVSRTSDGQNYIYTVKRLDLVFDASARSNPTNVISDPSLRFVTTVKTADGKPFRVTFESTVPIAANLDATHPRTTIQDVRFVVPTKVVDSADYAGLGVVNDKYLWPIGPDLKS